jgi:23S rRNA (guanosine2251-2'-O)-methyltransferase
VIIYGINPVLEALRAGHVRSVRVAHRHDRRLAELLEVARKSAASVEQVEAGELDRLSRGAVHQGVVAEVEAARNWSIGEVLAAAPGPALVVVLDGVEDPHNFGAILRVVDAAGADGVVRQTRHSAGIDGIAAKASAGAMAHVRIASVVNISRAIEELAGANVWTVGLVAGTAQRYSDLDLTQPTAIVLGAEGSGLRRLVRERCDILASLPMRGRVESLNVSVAAGIVLFEAVRQRDGRQGAGTKKHWK